MAENCVFCKIAAGEIPAKIVLDEPDLVAFHDMNAQAPVHVLVIPRGHIDNLSAAATGQDALLGRLLLAAARIAATTGIQESGFRVVLNAGPDAGQSVDHLHLHLLGGRSLGWPPG
jgi:histidine triad (HIT) family protein